MSVVDSNLQIWSLKLTIIMGVSTDHSVKQRQTGITTMTKAPFKRIWLKADEEQQLHSLVLLSTGCYRNIHSTTSEGKIRLCSCWMLHYVHQLFTNCVWLLFGAQVVFGDPFTFHKAISLSVHLNLFENLIHVYLRNYRHLYQPQSKTNISKLVWIV